MANTNCGCSEETTPCPSPVETCLKTNYAHCVYYTYGSDLTCIGVTASDNRKLSDILKLLDTQICTLSESDYSAFNYACVTDTTGGAITTLEEWVEGMSKAFCDYKTSNNAALVTITNNITTINTNFTANVNAAVITASVTCAELPGIEHTVGSTLSTDLDRLRTGICTTYNLLQSRTDLSANTWGSCLPSTTLVRTAIQNIANLLCTQQAQIAAISTSANPCGKFDTNVFDPTYFTDTITATTSCKNTHAITLRPDKILKNSATDVCGGYLFNKFEAGDGIGLSLQSITESICDYNLSEVLPNTSTFESIDIDGVTYTPGAAIVITDTTGISSYLNGLGLGTFVTTYTSGILTILGHEETGIVVQTASIDDGGGALNYNFVSLGCITSTCEKIVISQQDTVGSEFFSTSTFNDNNVSAGVSASVLIRKQYEKIEMKGLLIIPITINKNTGTYYTFDVLAMGASYRPQNFLHYYLNAKVFHSSGGASTLFEPICGIVYWDAARTCFRVKFNPIANMTTGASDLIGISFEGVSYYTTA